MEALTEYLGAFVDELVRSGVNHVVVSPGSRSTPLALLAAEHSDVKLWVSIDERSAGFFALGIAKATRSAVAVLCTSGTAAANYFPAVVEAFLSRVPLVVLTADRPHELRDVGAPQAIDQLGLYGSHIKWFSEMPIPETGLGMSRHARMTASRAVATAASQPCGPVHLNFPLREPLLPNLDSPSLWDGGRTGGASYTTVLAGKRIPDRAALHRLAERFAHMERGLIVCGPHDQPGFSEAVTRLAELLQYPILADPLSQLRSGSHPQQWIIDGYDAFLRNDKAAQQLAPEVIIRFGAMPVSKSLLLYINRYPNCRHIVVDEGGGWREPTLQATEMVHGDPVECCAAWISWALEQRRLRDSSSWANRWTAINRATRTVLDETDEAEGLFEGRLFTELGSLMEPKSTLFVGNSMPIRDLDTFYGNNSLGVRMMGNRGANGIDGVISTAMGASVHGGPTVLVLGDLSFYHDMNGLLAAKLHGLNVTIVLVNNDGGGIFSFLPQSTLPKHFETLFGTPIGLSFEHAVKLYEGNYACTSTWEQFRREFRRATEQKGLQVIEIRTRRTDNVTKHRAVWKKLDDALSDLLQGVDR